MVGIVNNLSTRQYSHAAGWNFAVRSILENKFDKVDIVSNKDDFDQYDVLIINEGVNYKPGQFNFFGGVQQRQIDALERFSNYTGRVYSICGEVDYSIILEKRKELRGYDMEFPVIEQLFLDQFSDKLVLGDSHSISVFDKGYTISRNDGKTLHGFLKQGISSYVGDNVTDLVFYAGNIDIRFHTHRHGIDSINKMIDELENQLLELESKSKVRKITLVHVLPIEPESRKIPGTGKYKGQNFFGSRFERMAYVRKFNRMITDVAEWNDWNVIEWDFDYDNFTEDDMESRQSVHLRPSSYKFKDRFVW